MKGRLKYVSRHGGKKLTVFYYARVFGIFWKCARVGERLSPYIGLCCVVMAVSTPDVLEL